MRAKYWAYAIILCCALLRLSARAEAAGIQLLDSDPSLTGVIWYPCAAEPNTVALGNLAVHRDFNADDVAFFRASRKWRRATLSASAISSAGAR